MFKTEKKIVDFFEKNYIALGFIVISILSIAIRYYMLPCKSLDYKMFLKPWFDYIKNNGGMHALAHEPSNYNAPYMTIIAILTYLPIKSLFSIKLVSIIFDYVLAVSCMLLVNEITKEKKFFNIKSLLIYSFIIFFPQVMFNSALWGQCDSIYTSFMILSLLFLIREEYTKSFIFLGISFAFKLQFIFILPLYIVLYVVTKKFSIINFLIIPFVDFILCIPALLYGKPLREVVSIYLEQPGMYKQYMTLNFPNIYSMIGVDPRYFYRIGFIFTVAICALTLIYIIYKKINWNNEKIMLLALYFILVVTYFLPGMHERYLYAGEVICLLYYYMYKKHFGILVFLILAPLITYSNVLHGNYFDYMPYLSIAFFVIIVYFMKNTLQELTSKNS